MSAPLKAAVVGAGSIARQHLACLSHLPEANLAAVCDVSPAVAEAVAERFGVPAWFTDHAELLETIQPDVVHVTTPPASHFSIAADALATGAHIVVEKPITLNSADLIVLLDRARKDSLIVIEDYNYLFNRGARESQRLVSNGALGEVVHLELLLAVSVLNPDGSTPPGTEALPGGFVHDYLPHLAAITHCFVGPHEAVRTLWRRHSPSSPQPGDELRALVQGQRATASITFSAHSRPEGFWLHLSGTRMRTRANLFESRFTVERTPEIPRPLIPLVNGAREAVDVAYGSLDGLWRKLGPVTPAYEGLWDLLRRTYRSAVYDEPPPVSATQIAEVNSLVRELSRNDRDRD